MQKRLIAVWCLTAMLTLPRGVFAQWATQTISLQPGWNAVQLLVQPLEDDCALVFSNAPIEQVQWWKKEGVGEEFDLDPAELYPTLADWRYWFATNVLLSTFGKVQAGECYEILSTNPTPFDLSIKGKVVLNPFDWIPSTWTTTVQNLVGLPVPSLPPYSKFQHFFSFSSAFIVDASTGTVFSVDTNGNPVRIFTPATTGIRRGQAYWITAGTDAHIYDGPIHVRTASGKRLIDFGGSLTPRILVLENKTATNRNVRIEQIASEPPPPASTVGIIGLVPLLFTDDPLDTSYQSMPSVLVTNVPANGSLQLKLAPDPQRLTNGVAGMAWQGILQVTDGNNDGLPDPVIDARVGVACNGELTGLAVPTGLWVGSVRVTRVNRAQTREGVEPEAWSSTNPVAVSRPYEFRVIFHVDPAGAVRLLQRILIASRPDGTNINQVIDLLTDETHIGAYKQQYPTSTITRVSSVCFPPMAPVTVSGLFGSSNTLSCLVQLPYDNPVNPFVHRYNPAHDNLEYRNGVAAPLEEGEESYAVSRTLWFEFSSVDPELGAANQRWGFTENGGSFREQVLGLNKTIYAEGAFRVEKVSDNGALQ